jgi:hypothetical protein
LPGSGTSAPQCGDCAGSSASATRPRPLRRCTDGWPTRTAPLPITCPRASRPWPRAPTSPIRVYRTVLAHHGV